MKTTEVQIDGITLSVTAIRGGQRRPYGDSIYDYIVSCETHDINDEMCISAMNSAYPEYCKVKSKANTNMHNIYEYFTGWYELEKKDSHHYAYRYTYPYDD